MSYNNAKLISTTYTGNTAFTGERGREYFMIQATDAALTVEFGGGTGGVSVPVGGFYEPYVSPSSEINVVTTGSFVVVSNV